jgi:hypothetical protein
MYTLHVCNATPKLVAVRPLSYELRVSGHVLFGVEFRDDYLQLEELRGSTEYRMVVRQYF